MKSTKAKSGGSRSSSKKQGNSNTSMLGGKFLYMNSITHPYYLRSCKRSIDSLPDDLISDILLRLPANFLHGTARFVCRRWSLIINSDAFVTTQVQHSTNGLLLSFHVRERDGRGRPILVTATRGRVAEVSQLSYVSRGVLLASSNGLAAELDWSRNPYIGTINVVNPATMQSHPLPLLDPNCHYRKCGIAFDKLSSKYKLTMLYYESDAFCLAILTFGVDNSWRKVAVEHVPAAYRFLLCAIPLSIEGFMHWAGQAATFLLTMDVESEIIRVVKLPRPCVAGRRLSYYFSTGKFLSLLIACETHLWEVWGMKSETGEWRKVLPDINLRRGNQWHQKFVSAGIDYRRELEPVGWVKYPEILAFFYYTESRDCFFYNLYTHRFSCIELPALCGSFLTFMHKNSLVRLG